MDTRQSYNTWADQYDTNSNKTSVIEAKAIRDVLSGISFGKCLERSYGTGKIQYGLFRKQTKYWLLIFQKKCLLRQKKKLLLSESK